MRNLLVIAVFLAACTPKPFPEKFLFGAATAGFQVDPGCPSGPCTDTRSDWYQWVTSASELQDLKDLITFEPLEHSRKGAIQGLVRLHDLEVSVSLDLEELQHLIKHLSMLPG